MGDAAAEGNGAMNRIRAACAGVLMAVAAAGCATTASAPADNELIQLTLDRWAESLVNQDIDAMMALFSDAYEGPGGKDRVRRMMECYAADGTLKDVQVELDSHRLIISGNRATVSPVYLSSAAGTAMVSFTLTKEEEEWKIVNMEINA